MLPTAWTTERLACRDATADDLPLLMAALAESQDIAALDPAFGATTEADMQPHLDRHLRAPDQVRMQVLYRRAEGATGQETSEFVGFWRLVRVPSRPMAIGVEILLMRPAYRRLGLAQELVAAALEHLRGLGGELWARVYLANVRAMAFWMNAGLRRVVEHQGALIHGMEGDDLPSLILSRAIEPRPMTAETPSAAPDGLGKGDELPPLPPIRLGRWRHYKGLDYEVLGVVRHSETLEPMVLYRPLYNDSGTWVRPYAMFLETVEVDGRRQSRFEFLAAKAEYPADPLTAYAAASPKPPDSWPEGWVIDIQDQHSATGLAVVDEGLGAYNTSAAPLHEVRPLACLAQDPEHRVMGGAVGRLWADCAELQQMWVHETLRSQGLGRRLLMAFEEAARDRGANKLFLETFSFQAPTFYERCGYVRESTNPHYPHGISKHRFFKRLFR